MVFDYCQSSFGVTLHLSSFMVIQRLFAFNAARNMEAPRKMFTKRDFDACVVDKGGVLVCILCKTYNPKQPMHLRQHRENLHKKEHDRYMANKVPTE